MEEIIDVRLYLFVQSRMETSPRTKKMMNSDPFDDFRKDWSRARKKKFHSDLSWAGITPEYRETSL